MRSFFSSSEGMGKVSANTIPQCGACGLHKKCRSPKMEAGGKGTVPLLIVGDRPNDNEDKEGTHFIDSSSDQANRSLSVKPYRMLSGELLDNGVRLSDCHHTHSIICRPTQKPYPDATFKQNVVHCRPNIVKTIETLEPKVILLLGTEAVRSVLGHLFTEDPGNVYRWLGYSIPVKAWNCYVVPAMSVKYLASRASDRNPVPSRMFKENVKQACSLLNQPRPGDSIPDYKSQVECVYDPKVAAKLIGKFSKGARPVAFDYETNMLKPEGVDASIYSCSLSDGKRTIAYPWNETVAQATSEFLKSRVPKLASNMKFEERWTRRILGHPVRNWAWDTMVAAHWINNAQATKSIKFQAFVELGVPIYNQHIEPFLESKGTMVKNRIQDIKLEDLLIYNGLDSLLEYHVAMRQKEVRDRHVH